MIKMTVFLMRLFHFIVLMLIVVGCVVQQPRPVIIKDAERLNNEGVRAFQEANWYLAKQLFSKSLLLYQGLDNQDGILLSYINLIEVALAAGDLQTADKYLMSATEIIQLEGLKCYQSRVGLLFSKIAIKKRQFDKAQQFLSVLLPEFEGVEPKSPLDLIQLSAIANQTRITFEQDMGAELWTQRYEQALKVAGVDSGAFQGLLLRFKAKLLLKENKFQQAAEKLEQALVVYKVSLVQHGIAASLSELGLLYFLEKDWSQAKHYLTRANVVLRYIGNRDKILENIEKLAIIESKLGHVERSHRIRKWLAERKQNQLKQEKKDLPLLESKDYLNFD